MLVGLDHVSVLVSDLERSLQFYQGVLGLTLQKRPDLGFEGAWLSIGAEQSLHLLCLPNPDAHRQSPVHVGRDRHLALRVSSMQMMKERLEAAQIPFTLSHSGRNAIFCRDPDGNGIELVERS